VLSHNHLFLLKSLLPQILRLLNRRDELSQLLQRVVVAVVPGDLLLEGEFTAEGFVGVGAGGFGLNEDGGRRTRRRLLFFAARDYYVVGLGILEERLVLYCDGFGLLFGFV
jgi:hypothetical protein